jgi:hypothetical protein
VVPLRLTGGPARARRRCAGTALILLLAACNTGVVRRITGRSPDSTPQPAALTVDSAPTTISVVPPSVDTTVAWPDLVGTLRRNPDGVRAVMQTHARKVTMVMKDGRRFHATEPAIDAIISILREVDPAGQILVATE